MVDDLNLLTPELNDFSDISFTRVRRLVLGVLGLLLVGYAAYGVLAPVPAAEAAAFEEIGPG